MISFLVAAINWARHSIRITKPVCLSYLLGALTVARPGSPKIIYENIGKNLSCEFEGRPRPFITWYIDGKSIMSEFEELSHTELETLQDDGIFKVTSTLYIPGREKFHRLSFTCSGTNNLSSGWSSSARQTVSVRFKCKCFSYQYILIILTFNIYINNYTCCIITCFPVIYMF